MRMCVEHDAANEQGDTIATLKTNLLCTRYSLEINWVSSTPAALGGIFSCLADGGSSLNKKRH